MHETAKGKSNVFYNTPEHSNTRIYTYFMRLVQKGQRQEICKAQNGSLVKIACQTKCEKTESTRNKVEREKKTIPGFRFRFNNCANMWVAQSQQVQNIQVGEKEREWNTSRESKRRLTFYFQHFRILFCTQFRNLIFLESRCSVSRMRRDKRTVSNEQTNKIWTNWLQSARI